MGNEIEEQKNVQVVLFVRKLNLSKLVLNRRLAEIALIKGLSLIIDDITILSMDGMDKALICVVDEFNDNTSPIDIAKKNINDRGISGDINITPFANIYSPDSSINLLRSDDINNTIIRVNTDEYVCVFSKTENIGKIKAAITGADDISTVTKSKFKDLINSIRNRTRPSYIIEDIEFMYYHGIENDVKFTIGVTDDTET